MNAQSGDWFAGRVPAPPPALAAALASAVAAVAPGERTPSAGVLGAAAVHTLRAALAHIDERSAAYQLLAADALLTYALECAAESGESELESVLAAWAPASIATIGSER